MTNNVRQYLYNRPNPGKHINWSHPLAYKLVGCWLLNEKGNRAYNLTSYNNGTLTNFINPSSSRIRSTLGIKFTSASSQYISIQNQVIFPNINNAFTICGWYNTVSSEDQTIFGEALSGSTNNSVCVRVNNTVAGNVSLSIRDNVAVAGNVTVNVDSYNGKWHNVVGIQRTKSLRELYFDGVLIGTNTTSLGSILPNNSKIGAQQRNFIAQYFNGTIGLVQVYCRALSSKEVQKLYINPYEMLIH